MQFNWDTLIGFNMILCFVIFIYGIITWSRAKSKVALYMGVAFGIFGLSHLATLLSLDINSIVRIVVRLVAYLLVIYGMFLAGLKKK
jgi:uncharacterized membrane protein (UPF0136 family)